MLPVRRGRICLTMSKIMVPYMHSLLASHLHLLRGTPQDKILIEMLPVNDHRM